MKRVSRRELKDKIKSLRLELLEARHDLEYAKHDKEKLLKRLELAGEKTETWDTYGNIRAVKASSQPYGIYMTTEAHYGLSEAARRILTEKLVDGLMKEQLVQFIMAKDNFDPLGNYTVAAKLFVTPWEQMRKW